MEQPVNVATRFLALFVFSLFVVGTLATIAGVSLWLGTDKPVPNFGRSNYASGAGLCFIAAGVAFGTGAVSLVASLRR